jgi:predicted amidohydrolase YtcJ
MLFILALFAGVLAAQTADLAITGGRIYTANARQPEVRALAVKDGKILAAGDDVSRHVGASTRKIDLKGATVIPGLIDSHVHMRGLGESLEILDLRHARSPA